MTYQYKLYMVPLLTMYFVIVVLKINNQRKTSHISKILSIFLKYSKQSFSSTHECGNLGEKKAKGIACL